MEDPRGFSSIQGASPPIDRRPYEEPIANVDRVGRMLMKVMPHHIDVSDIHHLCG